MNNLLNKLQEMFAMPVPERAWQQLLQLLDQNPSLELGIVESGLSQWNYITTLRQPPEAVWQQLQTGGVVPRWWPLVRHLNMGRYDRLDHLPLNQISSLRVADDVEFDGECLTHLPNLITLDLSGVTVDCQDLQNASTVQRLILRRADPSHLDALANLPALTDLDVSETKGALSDLAACRSLKQLNVSGNRINDFAFLTTMPALEILIAAHCSGQPSWQPLQSCPALRQVVLADSNMDISGVSEEVLARVKFVRGG